LGLGDWLRPPREPSAAGMLLLSGLGGLLVARPPVAAALAAVAVLGLHFLSFDPAFSALRRRRVGAFAALAAANAAPYLVALAAGAAEPAPILAAAGFLAAYGLLFARRGPRDPLVYVAGAAVPVLPGLTLPALVGAAGRGQLLYWGLLTAHAVATAAYVESRLPWRRLSPLVAVAVWAPAALAGVAAEPSVAAAVVEPTVKVAWNAVSRNRFIEPGRLRRLGWVEMARLLLFASLLLAALLLSPG